MKSYLGMDRESKTGFPRGLKPSSLSESERLG